MQKVNKLYLNNVLLLYNMMTNCQCVCLVKIKYLIKYIQNGSTHDHNYKPLDCISYFFTNFDQNCSKMLVFYG